MYYIGVTSTTFEFLASEFKVWDISEAEDFTHSFHFFAYFLFSSSVTAAAWSSYASLCSQNRYNTLPRHDAVVARQVGGVPRQNAVVATWRAVVVATWRTAAAVTWRRTIVSWQLGSDTTTSSSVVVGVLQFLGRKWMLERHLTELTWNQYSSLSAFVLIRSFKQHF